MRTPSLLAVLSISILAAACDNKGESSSPTPNTQAPIVQKAVSPITQGLADAAKQANELGVGAGKSVEAVKAEVAKYQAQVDGYTKQLAELTGKKDAAQKALDEINAKAQAQIAPLQKQLDELNKQIAALQAIKVGRVGKYQMAAAGFSASDVGGLLSSGSDKVAALKVEADKYQKQIDDILAQAKSAGLPYVDEIASYTESIKGLTGQLATAQGLLKSANEQLASLTAEPK